MAGSHPTVPISAITLEPESRITYGQRVLSCQVASSRQMLAADVGLALHLVQAADRALEFKSAIAVGIQRLGRNGRLDPRAAAIQLSDWAVLWRRWAGHGPRPLDKKEAIKLVLAQHAADLPEGEERHKDDEHHQSPRQDRGQTTSAEFGQAFRDCEMLEETAHDVFQYGETNKNCEEHERFV